MIGIICAMNVEVQGLIKKMENSETKTVAGATFYCGKIKGKDVVCTECGVGKVNAAMTAQIMIDLYHPDVIINSGVAGSLSREVSIGDIVISKDCVQHDMDTTQMGDPKGLIWFANEKRIDLPADETTAQKLFDACSDLIDTKVIMGRIASGDTFVADREQRLNIGEMFEAVSCEMEGAAVGQVCYRNEVPFAILRCISDDIDENEVMSFDKFCAIAAEKSIKAIENYLAL